MKIKITMTRCLGTGQFEITGVADSCPRLDEVLEIRDEVDFHGYKILRNGVILNKSGHPLRKELRARKGGKFDECVRLSIGGKPFKFTVQRLIAAAFQGPIFGYEINHDDRDTLHNHNNNLSRMTASENQKHWRGNERKGV